MANPGSPLGALSKPEPMGLYQEPAIGRQLPSSSKGKGKLKTLTGVFIPTFCSVFGSMLFVRMSWVVGQGGIGIVILLWFLSCLSTFLTSLSISAIATNGQIASGGSYYMISRYLGPEFGGAVGILNSLALSVGPAMEILGLTEMLLNAFPIIRITGTSWDRQVWIVVSPLAPLVSTDPRGQIIALIVMVILSTYVCLGATFVAKISIFFIANLLLVFVWFFVGMFITHPELGSGPTGRTSSITGRPHTTRGGLFTLLGLFYPCVCDINAGADRSRELDNPQISIPRGTVAGVAASSFAYLFAVVMMAFTAPREVLKGNSSVILQGGWPHKYVLQICVLFVSAGSALQYLTGGPQVLQAVAIDGTVPFLKFLAPGKEPRRFFMLTYAFTNLACFLLAWQKAPNFRPRFRWFHWSTALLAILLLVALMFMINWWVALIAWGCAFLIYKYIQYKGVEANWGDGLKGLRFQNARDSLLALERNSSHTKNWRPQILAFVKMSEVWTNPLHIDPPKRHFGPFGLRPTAPAAPTSSETATGAPSSPEVLPPALFPSASTAQLSVQVASVTESSLLSFLKTLKKGNGLTILGRVLLGEPEDRTQDLSKDMEMMRKRLKRLQMEAFPECIVAPSFHEGAIAMSVRALQDLCFSGPFPFVIASRWHRPHRSFAYLPSPAHLLWTPTATHLHLFSIRFTAGCDCCRMQCAGLGRLRPNAVLLGWPHRWREDAQRTDQYVDMMKQITDSDRALLLLKSLSPFPDEANGKADVQTGTIDVWWVVHDGGLLLLLPVLLKRSKIWKKCRLRIFSVAGQFDNSVEMERLIKQYLYDLRIEATVEIIDLDTPELLGYTNERTLALEERLQLLQSLNMVSTTTTVHGVHRRMSVKGDHRHHLGANSFVSPASATSPSAPMGVMASDHHGRMVPAPGAVLKAPGRPEDAPSPPTLVEDQFVLGPELAVSLPRTLSLNLGRPELAADDDDEPALEEIMGGGDMPPMVPPSAEGEETFRYDLYGSMVNLGASLEERDAHHAEEDTLTSPDGGIAAGPPVEFRPMPPGDMRGNAFLDHDQDQAAPTQVPMANAFLDQDLDQDHGAAPTQVPLAESFDVTPAPPAPANLPPPPAGNPFLDHSATPADDVQQQQQQQQQQHDVVGAGAEAGAPAADQYPDLQRMLREHSSDLAPAVAVGGGENAAPAAIGPDMVTVQFDSAPAPVDVQQPATTDPQPTPPSPGHPLTGPPSLHEIPHTPPQQPAPAPAAPVLPGEAEVPSAATVHVVPASASPRRATPSLSRIASLRHVPSFLSPEARPHHRIPSVSSSARFQPVGTPDAMPADTTPNPLSRLFVPLVSSPMAPHAASTGGESIPGTPDATEEAALPQSDEAAAGGVGHDESSPETLRSNVQVAVQLNQLIKQRSSKASLVFLNLPPISGSPAKCPGLGPRYMEYLSALTADNPHRSTTAVWLWSTITFPPTQPPITAEGVDRMVMVRGSGTEVVTIYS
ncbi:Cation-chloride cotransporter [Paratrimastix pyriformis]|uniref:Cation-chloride cotransporter n=1 Tax=Paratrimastix pyriformis TaxID=342808 RepID=A0ABQ8UIK4_9EUKA|nr:Cation-chloride cotransporter [Paratrimastix pyriformis]